MKTYEQTTVSAEHARVTSITVAPLTTWPGALTADHARQRSKFSTPLSLTLPLLTRELDMLGARNAVLEVAIPAEQFRIDGRPRATARATHPGVVLSLPTTKFGALRYATDTFTTWTDNLRAIALGLEALRKVERYGITRRGEQYAGFKALPAAPMVENFTEFTAAVFLRECSGLNDFRGVSINQQYRAAVKRMHPDSGGDTADFQRLQDSMRVLRGEKW